MSLLTDAATGGEPGEALRACRVAVALAGELGLSAWQTADVYHASLLRNIGCTATAADEAARFGVDETALRPLLAVTDPSRPTELLRLLRRAAASAPSGRRATLVLRLSGSERFVAGVQDATSEVAAVFAGRLGLGPGVQEALAQQYERWDGGGRPHGLAGERVGLPARICSLAAQAVRLSAMIGPEEAVALLRGRHAWLGPELVRCFGLGGEELLARATGGDAYNEALAVEPEPHRLLDPATLPDQATVLADLADLKSPWLRGHSRAVAALVGQALPGRQTPLLAALLHDLGRIAVPARVWDRPGELTELEREAVELHAYHGERVLRRCAPFAACAPLVGRHHERLDGSGYHRRLAAPDLSPEARLLAAADCFTALTEPRPHRPPCLPAEAAGLLHSEVRAGRLDADAVDAVLAAAGRRGHRRPGRPAGLGDRDVEVLRLLARGRSDRDIAVRLGIGPRGAQRRVEQVLSRTGARTRAAAALFAMEQDLLTGP
ncbi:HD domain-containing phosphohydrolase [Streptacidiphilus rugosus]|uniref:HD domain-containing phosphohydrolase n=1 Tax=Streptacidiphilus rugosus TaxID=405783 RepID=UPI000AF219E4|nr:HD domain-containing phosphohydrolase [Streptacidiphilus rugosus]